jgi:hypothetical protein
MIKLLLFIPPVFLATVFVKDTIKDLREQYRETGRLLA